MTNKVMYRLVINFERADDLGDLMEEIALFVEREVENQNDFPNRVAMYAETVFPFEMENDNA